VNSSIKECTVHCFIEPPSLKEDTVSSFKEPIEVAESAAAPHDPRRGGSPPQRGRFDRQPLRHASRSATVARRPARAADDARYKRALEDNRRQIAEAEQRQREFEQQKAAEAEAAKERDRQAKRG
jgi:hypothetical protein